MWGKGEEFRAPLIDSLALYPFKSKLLTAWIGGSVGSYSA
jgi:hypothetical protein